MEYHIQPNTNLVKQLPYYITELHRYEHMDEAIMNKGNASDAFFYCTLGSGELFLQGKRYELVERVGFFLPAHTPYKMRPKTEHWELRVLMVAGKGLPYLYSLTGLQMGQHPLWNLTGLEIQMNKIHQELTENATYGILLASTHADEFIAEYAKQAGFLSNQRTLLRNHDTYSTHLRMMEDYIHDHYTERITSTDLCALTDLTPQHVCRIFRKKTGMSPVEYIQKKRIEHAKQMLKNSDGDILQIGLECGFESSNYFWKKFKAFEGITPGEYRKRYKK